MASHWSIRAQEEKKEDDEELPERLKGCDKELVKRIEQEVIDSGSPVTFEDVAGLADAKRSIQEMVIWPMQRPELFTGLRAVPKGMLVIWTARDWKNFNWEEPSPRRREPRSSRSVPRH